MKKYFKFESIDGLKSNIVGDIYPPYFRPSDKFNISRVTENDDVIHEWVYHNAFISHYEVADGKIKFEISYDRAEERLYSKKDKK